MCVHHRASPRASNAGSFLRAECPHCLTLGRFVLTLRFSADTFHSKVIKNLDGHKSKWHSVQLCLTFCAPLQVLYSAAIRKDKIRHAVAKVKEAILKGETPNNEPEMWKALDRMLHAYSLVVCPRNSCIDAFSSAQKATGDLPPTAHAIGPAEIVTPLGRSLSAQDASDGTTRSIICTGPGSLVVFDRGIDRTTCPQQRGDIIGRVRVAA